MHEILTLQYFTGKALTHRMCFQMYFSEKNNNNKFKNETNSIQTTLFEVLLGTYGSVHKTTIFSTN